MRFNYSYQLLLIESKNRCIWLWGNRFAPTRVFGVITWQRGILILPKLQGALAGLTSQLIIL